MTEKVVLAYSGGLDTSVAIKWLEEMYSVQVVTLTVDAGGAENLDGVRDRALQTGAVKALVVDGRELFVTNFVWPALQAGAIYEGEYPLATALARPLIVQFLVQIAQQEGAFAIAHGCTGKGNDQVRFDVGAAALAPNLKIIAPAREWGMSRSEEIEYARSHNIPLGPLKQSAYSVDENLWGRSIEAGDLEDPWKEPTEEAFAWTRPVNETPDRPCYVEIGFEMGIPVTLDREKMGGVALIDALNRLAGEHGVGRIDHIENRLVGIKSREVYEAPAGVVLHRAHRALENMVLSKEQSRFKAGVAQEYADVVYNGLWFTSHRRDLATYVKSSQRCVSGSVRMRLHRGTCAVVGRRSDSSLYQHQLATYDKDDAFDHRAAEGFINIFGLPVRTQSQVQGQELETSS